MDLGDKPNVDFFVATLRFFDSRAKLLGIVIIFSTTKKLVITFSNRNGAVVKTYPARRGRKIISSLVYTFVTKRRPHPNRSKRDRLHAGLVAYMRVYVIIDERTAVISTHFGLGITDTATVNTLTRRRRRRHYVQFACCTVNAAEALLETRHPTDNPSCSFSLAHELPFTMRLVKIIRTRTHKRLF